MFELLADPHPETISVPSREYIRLVRTAKKSIERKKALRELNRAHDAICLAAQLLAKRCNELNDQLNGSGYWVWQPAPKKSWWRVWR